ncbi:LysM peptidoglycan-binding domain-containing protein [Nocardia stercoris]|uniref:LysM peptidoglycan-binding domain-containing protein n=1 Tax=Nocardia stercoris TaxID=2483361 RepID=A0A3M2KR43_9NOCA|nr:LysM peptidoglycan-binding domain-containing protein [Nocardia stercoris]RMI28117.1 LysM peptidoglycan-binding domain-containing protein [Nocardia stercoris]
MGDTLNLGQELGLGQSLQGGAYALTLQEDGNLVLTEPGGNVVWAAMTHGQNVNRAVLQDDGNFVVYRSDGTSAWSTDTDGRAVDRLVVQSDRNVVLYDRDGNPIWATDTVTDNPMPAPDDIAQEMAATAAADQAGARTYTVEPGDTLWAIAERFYGDGNRYEEIAVASGIDNPDLVNVGQVLTIP